MHVRDATSEDLTVVAGWIDSARACEHWAGPRVPYPFDLRHLAEHIAMAGALNLAATDERGLVAFGQALPRGPGRAHFTRIIVRPDARGAGIGRVFCEAMLERAASAGSRYVTLYVYRDNPGALHLYESLGFRPTRAPEGEQPSPEVVFMQHLLKQGRPMEQRLTIVSLGVADVEAARRFYETGLGWEVSPASVGDFVLFALRGGVGLALYPRELLAHEAGVADLGGFGGVTLSHNVDSAGEVDAVLAAVVAAGATLSAPASEKPWGYTGYFTDLDGHPWEVAHVPSLEVRDGMLEG